MRDGVRVSRTGCYDGSMTNYKSGTVARLRVHGREATAVRYKDGWAYVPEDSSGIAGTVGYCDDIYGKFTDIRPLVVLDLGTAPENIGTWEQVHMRLRQSHLSKTAQWLADQIEEQAKPARIPEPGVWGVVSDNAGDYWVRLPMRWVRQRDTQERPWSEIVDPDLIREGVDV